MIDVSQWFGYDWYSWTDPDPTFPPKVADVPGFSWSGIDDHINFCGFHTSHLPVMPPEVQDAVAEIQAKRSRPPVGPFQLRPYQAEDLPWLQARRGTLLAYEMRLGKTAAATCAHNPADGPLVVVGPLVAQKIWREWIGRVWNVPLRCLEGRTVTSLDGLHDPAIFCHYDILEAQTHFLGHLGAIGTLVLDEAHLLQNAKSRRFQGAVLLSSKAHRVIALTGTPIWSRPESLHPILDLLAPRAFGRFHDFGVRYCNGQPGQYGWNYKGKSNQDELRQRLDHVVRRRTWADVAPHLPPTTRIRQPVPITPAQLADVERAVMLSLRTTDRATQVGYLAKLRRKLGEFKVKAAVTAAKQAIADGHKVVVWTWHKGVAGKIKRALGLAWPLDATMSQDDRDNIVGAFQVEPQPCAMVASLGVGSTAIDLSCATHAVFAEFDWTPAVVYQAEMRTFHPTRPMVAEYLYADVPIDAALLDTLLTKNENANDLGLGYEFRGLEHTAVDPVSLFQRLAQSMNQAG